MALEELLRLGDAKLGRDGAVGIIDVAEEARRDRAGRPAGRQRAVMRSRHPSPLHLEGRPESGCDQRASYGHEAMQ